MLNYEDAEEDDNHHTETGDVGNSPKRESQSQSKTNNPQSALTFNEIGRSFRNVLFTLALPGKVTHSAAQHNILGRVLHIPGIAGLGTLEARKLPPSGDEAKGCSYNLFQMSVIYTSMRDMRMMRRFV